MNLEVWACPVCLSRLEETQGGLRCTTEARVFPRRHGLGILLRPVEEGLLQDAEVYAAAWKRVEWAPPRGALLELPYLRGGGWKQKARSFEALLDLLGPVMGREVADVGAGTGWLSYRLAIAGFRCFAIDISADLDVGLGAAAAYDATPYRFERAIASLTRWPLLDRSIDVAICNASLHYSPDIGPALAEAARVLRPGGTFVAMNHPVHGDPRSATRASTDFRRRLLKIGGHGLLVEGHRHFVAAQLEADLRRFFGEVRRHDPDYGPWFRATRAAKGNLLRMELASFPIYVAVQQG